MKNIYTILIVGAILVNSPLSADAAGNGRNNDARQLRLTYARYVQAIQKHGLVGFREFAEPNLVIRWEKSKWQGQNAFAELNKYYSGVEKGEFSVIIHQIKVNGSHAIAVVDEVSKTKLVNSNGKDGHGYATIRWSAKQTWHKDNGWKQVSWDKP